MKRDLKNNPVVLTEEQQNLITENINLVYKFCSRKGIYDEDIIQSLIVRVCIAVPTYDSSKGKFSTFVFKVLEHELPKQFDKIGKTMVPPEFEECRLEQLIGSDTNADEMSEIIGIEDPAFESIERRDIFNKALKEYKYRFPLSWRRNLKICYYIANNLISLEDYENVFGISHQRAYQIVDMVREFFINFSNGNIVPTKIDMDVDNTLFKFGEEQFCVNNESDLMLVLGWIKNRIKFSDRTCRYSMGSYDLADIASKELGLHIGNADMKRAMFLSGCMPSSSDFMTNPNWKYYINRKSNLFKTNRGVTINESSFSH